MGACRCLLVFWAAICAVASAATAAEAVLRHDGRVRVDGCEIVPVIYVKGWNGVRPSGEYEIKSPGLARLRFMHYGRKIANATASLTQADGELPRLEYEIVAAEEFETETVACIIILPAAAAEGQPWRADAKMGTFHHPEGGGIGIAHGKCSAFGLTPGKGRLPLVLSSADPVDYLVQDDRKWADDYVVRLGDTHSRRFAKGDTFKVSFTLKSTARLEVKDAKPYVVSPGEEWIPLEYSRDIEQGSALDFSHMGFADAPAGKHGWLKNVGGHFEFEGLPGVPQRFYGVNLCGTANFPGHELADALVARFRRFGYNAIRVHHHDAGTVEGSADGLTLNAENMERLDYLLAAAMREGLYITTDIYVSRGRKIKRRHLGVDRDGTLDIQHFKALCAVYEPALENWKAYARNLLCHVNKYTGRRYIDEPALPLISLVNEGGFFMGWERGVRDDPRVIASWAEWLAAKRAADPSFAPGLSGDSLPEHFWASESYPFIAQWTGELEARMVSRMKAFLRSLGCRALLTNDNCGPHYASLQHATEEYDYIDDHFYVDHPSFLERPWSLPSKCPNRNPLLGNGNIAPATQAFTRMLDKPFTITEWNFSAPGRYRGAGGMLTGAMAALQGWDGLWRFAYSHSRDRLGNRDRRSLGYFDLASDPLSQASDRACLCLFMRGDMAPFTKGVALWDTPESASKERVLSAAPKWRDVAWRMRVGSCLSPDAAGGLRVLRREDADATEVVDGAEPCALRIDRERGAFTIDTSRTCGGFAMEGEIAAGHLAAVVSGSPAAVWVSSLDGAAIPMSRRLLLSHLTDVQGAGEKFADDEMTVLLGWGGPLLARSGTAEISLRLNDPKRYVVYELSTSGRRIHEIPATASDGRLRFTASVAGPAGARMLYEIAARQTP